MHTVKAPNERTWSIVVKNVIYAHSIPYNSSDKIVYILMYYIILSCVDTMGIVLYVVL